MKIALALFKYFPHGGLQRDFMRITLELLKRGHEVTLFTTSFDGVIPEKLQVVFLETKSFTNHGKAAEFEKLFAVAAAGYDVKFGFNRIGGLDFYFAADNCIMSEALTVYPEWFLKLSPRHRSILRQEKNVLAPESATRILYIAEKQKKDYQKFYGTPEERFFYLPPGLNEACFRGKDAEIRRNRKRQEYNIGDDEILLILVGSFFEGKGADRLLRAVAALEGELQKKCRIAIIGNMPRKKCLKLCRSLDIDSGNLIMPGASGEVPDWLLAADLMVHPARKEATGTVIVEALAAGLPVIASSECGFANFAAESGGCALKLPFDQQELNRKLREFLQPEKLAELKESAVLYGSKADFCRRASVAADLLEQFHD
ncbi:MAG: glycosyltransferase family 4 protein [Lentisphaeria bacterium]|nr:glycosyltransferase family 4 protein [Lentisphaeria bacterium]